MELRIIGERLINKFFISRLDTTTTMVENYLKCPISIFQLLAFSTNFCPIKSDLSVNTV